MRLPGYHTMRFRTLHSIPMIELYERRFFHTRQIILLFLIAGAVCLTSACKKRGTEGVLENLDLEDSKVHRLDTMLLSTPSTVEIHADSLIRTLVQERKVKAGKPGIIDYTGVKTFVLKSSESLSIHSLPEITPGSGSSSAVRSRPRNGASYTARGCARRPRPPRRW